MIVTYYGKQFFKVQFGDTVLAFNPISKESKTAEKTAKFGADIALITTNHPDYNGIDNAAHGEKLPFAITGPGDYEIHDIFVKGVLSETEIGGKKYINTIYTLAIDNINLCFLGHLSSKELTHDAREAIGSPDMVFVPIGGKDVLEAHEAHKLAVSLDPKIIIPMDYGPEKEGDALKLFLKEGGKTNESLDKLTIKRKDLDGREADIVVLQY